MPESVDALVWKNAQPEQAARTDAALGCCSIALKRPCSRTALRPALPLSMSHPLDSVMSVADPPPAQAAASFRVATPGLRRKKRSPQPGGQRRLAVFIFLAALLIGWHVFALHAARPHSRPGARGGALRGDVTDWGYLAYAIDSIHVIAAVAIAFTLGGHRAARLFLSGRAVYDLSALGAVPEFFRHRLGVPGAYLVRHHRRRGVRGCGGTCRWPSSTPTRAAAAQSRSDRDGDELQPPFSRRTWYVILPMLFPYLATLRLCVGIGWQIVLTAELLNGSGGLGTIINVARARYATDMLFAAVFLIVIVVFVTDRLVFTIQARLRRRKSSKPAIRSKAFLQARLVAEGLSCWRCWCGGSRRSASPIPVFPSPVNVPVGPAASRATEFWKAPESPGACVGAVAAAVIFGSLLGLMPRYLPWTRHVDDVLIPLSTPSAVAWAIIGSVWLASRRSPSSWCRR